MYCCGMGHTLSLEGLGSIERARHTTGQLCVWGGGGGEVGGSRKQAIGTSKGCSSSHHHIFGRSLLGMIINYYSQLGFLS